MIEKGEEKEKKRNVDMRGETSISYLSYAPQLGTEPAT